MDQPKNPPTLIDVIRHHDLRNAMTVSFTTPLGKLELILPPGVIPAPPREGDPTVAASVALAKTAVAKIRNGDLAGGEQDLQDAVAANPLVIFNYGALAELHENQGQLAAAEQNAKQLIALEPTHANLARLARILGRMKRYPEAKVIYEHLWNARGAVKPAEALEVTFAHLVTLHRAGDAQGMVDLAAQATVAFGPHPVLVYQQVLGNILLDRWDAAARGFLEQARQFDPAHPLQAKLHEIGDIIAQHELEADPARTAAGCQIQLESIDPARKLQAIKALTDVKLGLAAAKQIVEAAPTTFTVKLTPSAAADLTGALRGAGAVVKLVS